MTDVAPAADDRDKSVSAEGPAQYSLSLCHRSLSRDHLDRLEVSESEGQHSNERWQH